ncbi:MAG TPA: hypothetical protein VF484_10270, partial [Candidatus Limnocylindrales bacterium]
FRPSLAGGGARDANLGRQLVRLRPAAASGSSAGTAGPGTPLIRLAAPGGDGRSVDALGIRWAIRPG